MNIRPGRRATAAVAAVAAASLLVASCSGESEVATSPSGQGDEASQSTAVDDASQEKAGDEAGGVTRAVLDPNSVHTIAVDFSDDDYQTMLETYASSSTKEWIAATVTIDGTTYRDAGIRLKGNSSLAGLGGGFGRGTGGDVSADDPSGLPWLIKLDKYIDDQNHDGMFDFVVRSNASATSLNEAVALDLLDEAGLATQDAIAVRFSVNGSEETLRLVIEHPDDVWMADNFDADDALYKAESTGNYSYRGDDQASYDEVFDQEAGKDNTDLAPLIEFLDFINNADDETFAAEISERFDVDSFATYLAMQEVVQNFDDIDGPGNNSYLHWDAETGRFTVVPWDYNLAFGGLGGFGGPGGFDGNGPGGAGGAEGTPGAGGAPGGFDPDNLPEGFEPPEGGFGPGGFNPDDLPEGFEPPEGAARGRGGGFGGGGPGGSNVLVERFLAVEEFNALYEERLSTLTAELIDSGRAEEILDQWVAVIQSGAGDLVDEATITTEADQLRSTF